MGCDYYIEKILKVKFENRTDYIIINLESDRGWFDFSLDEDDPDYDAKYEKYVEETLKPNMKPIIIYENNDFLTKKLQDKYKLLIEKELKNYNKGKETDSKKEWKDIIKIVKCETRYERD